MIWDEIESALEAGDHARALERALEAWRACRTAPVADLVDVLGSKTTTAPIYANGAKAFQAAWLARAKDAAPSEVGALLSALTRSLPMAHTWSWEEGAAAARFAAWIERIDALSRLDDDPRVAAALFEVVRRGGLRITSYPSDTAAAYDPALRLIERIADERLLPPMRALVEIPTASRQTTRRYLSGALPEVVRAIEDAQQRQRPLEPALRERCEGIIERLGGRGMMRAESDARREGEAELLELVIASPDDDDAREVLADLWLERRDPRGELVTLQLKTSRGAATAADEKAVRALLRQHEKTWLEDVALVTKRRVFRRGFLDEIELLQNASADPKVWERVALDPRLATVRTVHKGKANETHYRRFVFSPAMRSLRDLAVVSKAMLQALCERTEPLPVEHVELAFMADRKTLAALAAAPCLPALASLTVGVTKGNVDKLLPLAAWFAEVRPLERIAVAPLRWYDQRDPLASWLAAARTTLAHVPVVEIDFTYDEESRASARRGARGLRLELVCTHLTFMSGIVAALKHDVEHLLLRVPQGRDVLVHEEHDARRLVAAFPPGVVELDAAWTAAVEAPPRPGPPRHRDA